MPLILLLPLMTTTLILLLTKMMMIMLSLLVFQIIPFYLRKHCKVTFLTMMTTKKMMTTTMTMMSIILEWSILLLFMMEEKTLLLLSIKPDYQLVQAVQMSLQVYLLIFPLFLGMDWVDCCCCKWSNESTEIFGAWGCRFATNHVVNAESITDQYLSYFRISRRIIACGQIIGWKGKEGSLHH